MANVVKQILGEIKGLALNQLKGWKPADAPPTVRELGMSYGTLERGGECVGAFVPEMYNLANAPEGGLLECQVAEKQYETTEAFKAAKPELYAQLHRADGTRKTPFELAVVPISNVGKEAIAAVTAHTQKEYYYRRDNALALPVAVSKYRIEPDYLKNIEASGLKLTGIYVEKINIDNPIDKLSKREIVFHYAGLWASFLLTVSASAALTLAGIISPVVAGLAITGMFIAKKTVSDFAMFDLAEGLTRYSGWLLYTPWKSKDGYKFNFVNSVKTLAKLAGLGVAIYFAAVGAFAGIMALPWVAGAGMAAAQLGFAGFFATLAGLTTLVGGLFTQSFFWNLSFVDNQVNVTKEMADALPTAQSVIKENILVQLEEILKPVKEAANEHHIKADAKVWLTAAAAAFATNPDKKGLLEQVAAKASSGMKL